jgi:dipeptidyl aminopeptidase/acylaminoacyl peptidase
MQISTLPRPRVASLVLVLALAFSGLAAKRPITHKDYDSWRGIQNQKLSHDGKFLAYALFPQEGDGELVLRDLTTGKEQREPIGARPEPPPVDYSAMLLPEERPEPRGIALFFTADSRAVVFSTFPPKAEADKAKKEKKKPEEMPKGGMVIIDLRSGAVARIPRVKNFQAPQKGIGFIAYLREPDTTSEKREKKKEYGSELVLRNLENQGERSFGDVLEYTLAKDAKTLVYAVSSKKEDTNGVYAFSGDGEPAVLLSGPGKYTKLAWDEKQTQVAFLSDRDDVKAKQPKFKLYHWVRHSAAAAELVSVNTAGFRQGFVLSDKASLSFSKDGKRLFFGCASPAPEERDAEAGASDDRVSVDLWHWKDEFIQPMQKVRANRERSRSFRAVYHLSEKKLVQLADPTMADITPSEDGRWALGGDDREYRPMVEYDDRYRDTYLVDALTGSRKLVARKHLGTMTWSPDGKYALLFDGKDWNTISVPEGATTNLTGKLGVNFWNEEHDSPGVPRSYGTAGWTKDGKYALLYDHYDIWQLSPDGAVAKNLTDGFGRKQRLQFRYVRLDPDPEEKFIDPAKPLLLRAENTETRESGFYRDRIDGNGPPLKLILGARNFGMPVKAKDAGVLVVTASTFNEFPDLHITDPDFHELRKVSNANPQKEQLLWGTAELIHYRSADGVPLNGILYKPENFDATKKYPLLVYIYERLSQNLHHFIDPRPSHTMNVSYYVSNGYLVLEPDIVYTVGYPGPSALKCVLPAIQAVSDRGFVDEKAIGIQGHSWGGYQIAYMITQTNRFQAAAAGAVVANMISAYDGIRWGPGLPRQFQYERTQSRIGGSLWQYPLRFIENSPVFRADRVATPLLMIHNDADDAVPWYQGIEYYLALRRLGKEVYMFNYNGEPHGLRKRVNQKDYTVRLQQFFDHYLKGAPKPEWMERGIPYLERDQEKDRLKAVTDVQ